MINVRFSLTNPWSSLWDAGWAWAGKITKHKAWEAQIYRANVVAEFMFEFTHRQDHAGLRLEFGLLSWCFIFLIHDTRHWNYDKQCYEVYNDKEDLL